ncbi:2OG-Fe(II) oxygenase [Cytophagaceae bacterium ABcell3]|nr:2OG-Fe(II) oxygenase [Cytophagaceae bacterium ABcell3]
METNILQQSHLEDDMLNRVSTDLYEKGYAILEHFISETSIALLKNEMFSHLEYGHFKKAGIGNKVNTVVKEEIRGDYIKWIDQNDHVFQNHPYFIQLEKIRQHLNQSFFLGLEDLEMHFAIYPAGKGYQRHSDQFKNDGGRKISAVFYLNEQWEEKDGGHLTIYLPKDNGREEVITVTPNGGTLVIFDSSLEHEVMPANRERCSITGWFLNRKILY